MGRLVKQSVTEVTFMDHMSHPDDVRCITLRIDSEGGGRFLVLSNQQKTSEIFLHTIEDLRLIYETAKRMWDQGDFLAPGDSAADYVGATSPIINYETDSFKRGAHD